MKAFPLLFLASASYLSAASSIDNFTAATNDRFANDPTFIAGGFDLSGVGRDASGRWATLIADNIFITADHFRASGSVTFFSGNSTLSSSFTRTVTGGDQLLGTDIFIGYLNAPLPTTIARYDLTTVARSSGGATAPVAQVSNEFLYSIGISPTTGGYGSSPLTNLAVGENRLEFYQDDVLVSGIGNTSDSVYTIKNNPIEPAHETYESAVNAGDSGSPLFTPIGGELVLVATATAEGTVASPPPNPDREFSLYTYVGNYDSEIQGLIDANLIAIPEPSTGLLLGFAGLPLLRRRRS